MKIFDTKRLRVRKLTPKEYGILQAFPMDRWKQVVSDSQAYKQFGNAVTVTLFKAIAEEIANSIHEAEKEEREQMKIFISQPMKGRDAEEIQKEREKAILALKAKYGEGVEIIDSFVKDFPKDANAAWFLGKSIELLSSADGALFLGNWYEARGCKIECHVCREYGIEIIKL